MPTKLYVVEVLHQRTREPFARRQYVGVWAGMTLAKSKAVRLELAGAKRLAAYPHIAPARIIPVDADGNLLDDQAEEVM